MTAISASLVRPRYVVEGLFLVVAVFFFVYLFRYYLTGIGGPTLLAVLLVPVCYMLFVLDELRRGGLYPKLGFAANAAIAALYVALAAYVAWYVTDQFMQIRTVRAGIWNDHDRVVGVIMVVLVLEYSRLRYFPLFIVNLLLLVYALYGWAVPGMFGHPGMSTNRLISAMSLEMTTGVFSRLPQLALTLIGSFLLVLSVLRAFGCVESILKGASRIAARSPQALPQAAVIGSFGVAAVSGSGAANAATTGSATIPAMIASGVSRTNAAAIETAASLGGQLMPPIMGISAFLMAEFLGRSYFDVVARGYAPALIFFASVVLAVYLLSNRTKIRPEAVRIEPMGWLDRANIAAFAAVVIGLIGLMGIGRLPPMIAAIRVFEWVGAGLLLVYLLAHWREGAGAMVRDLAARAGRFLETFAAMTGDLTLLLATLSIMTGAFVITGVPTKAGGLLMQAAGVHIGAMVLVAFLFGALLGTGLPPAPTYILTALVIAPVMIRAGIDPWVVHFFAFFLAVWGELTPPTSVVAAVTAKIADASFMRTLVRGIQICVSLFVLMAGVFMRPALVTEPGLAQLGAAALILVTTFALTFAIQARFAESRPADVAVRCVLAALALFVLFQPDEGLAWLGAVPIALCIAYWFARRRNAAG